MTKRFTALAGLFLMAVASTAAWALPTATGEFRATIYDTGGLLNAVNNGGFFLNGLEVDPAGGTVYVAASDAVFGDTSSAIRLINSTGLGTAALDAAGVSSLIYTTRGVDLTFLGGSYYVAACVPLTPPGKGMPPAPCFTPGIYGWTPGVGPVTFASGGTIPGWATSGLTFNPGGGSALVTSDVGISHWLVTPPSTGTLLVDDDPLPTGYESGADDHVITTDGRVLVMGDFSGRIYDITGGPGSVSLFFDVSTIPGFPGCGPAPGCFGSRGTVDPVTGDIFYAYAVGGDTIFRIRPDGSAGEVFATGFVNGVVDIDFGPASDGSGGISLYATEVAGTIGIPGKGGPGGPDNDVGTIYEFVRISPIIPTLSDWGKSLLILMLLGIAGFTLVRRRQTA